MVGDVKEDTSLISVVVDEGAVEVEGVPSLQSQEGD